MPSQGLGLEDRKICLCKTLPSKQRTSSVSATAFCNKLATAEYFTDYLARATDGKGDKLPRENLIGAVTVSYGAGFTTTSTLLSWLIYGLVT